MKRILLIVLCLALCLGVFGCGKKDDASSNAADTSSNATVVNTSEVPEGFSTETVNFANGYTVIRATDLSDSVTSKCLELYKIMRNSADENSSVKNMLDEDSAANSDNYEILIGLTNRPESAQALTHLITANNGRSEDYVIGAIGKKIVILAVNDEGLLTAISYFIDNFTATEYEGGIYHANLTETDTVVTVSGIHLGQYKIIRPVYNFSYIAQMRIDELIASAKDSYYYSLGCYKDRLTDVADNEIIIGKSGREGVENITNRDEYRITIKDTKVYLNGGSNEAIAVAVAEFSKLLSKGAITDADSVVGSTSATLASYDSASNYKLSWSDDFDGNKLDKTKWFQCYEGWYSSNGQNGRTSIRTNDPQYVFVSDGKYYANAGYDNEKYYGNMLLTHNTMTYKYGYVEMSAILPNGSGIWTALWIDSRHINAFNDPDDGLYFDMEIDVNECFGNANMVAANCHRHATTFGAQNGAEHFSLDGKYSRDKIYYCPNNDNFNKEMHTFGCLWDEDEFTFTCDGEVYFSWKNNETNEDLDGFHQMCYLRLSTAVGFASDPNTIIPDGDPAWTTSSAMIVDYMHLYQLKDGKQKILIGDGNGGWK